MPPYRKRRWIRLKKNVNAVIDKRLATNVLHLTDAAPLSRTNTIGLQQYYGGLTLLDAPVRATVQQAVDRLQPTNPAIANPGGRGKHVVVGMMNNLTITNTSTEGTAYIDVYYWRTKKNCAANQYNSIENLWSTGFTQNVENIPVTGGDSLTAPDLGVTPYANPAWRMYIETYMKRRIRLPAGSSTEMSLRSPKSFYSSGESLTNQLSLIRGKTEGIFIVWTGDPYQPTVGAPVRARQQTLIFTRVRTLYYKVLQSSVTTAGENIG